jgi:hypothetical protein
MRSGTIALIVAANAELNCSAEPLLPSGCEDGAVFFDDVMQQVLFAQQPG